jgi:hypothetical protein
MLTGTDWRATSAQPANAQTSHTAVTSDAKDTNRFTWHLPEYHRDVETGLQHMKLAMSKLTWCSIYATIVLDWHESRYMAYAAPGSLSRYDTMQVEG